MDETISVIIPVYNVEKYLRRCVNSVLESSYKELEIILVDDGSQDSSGKICDDYAIRDSRIKVIHKENGGLSDARNIGIKESTGEILTFIDSDDYISFDAISLMYKAKLKYKAQISCCLFRLVDDNYNKIKRPVAVGMEAFSCTEALEKMLRQSEIFCSAWGKLFDRDLFSDVLYPVGELHEDLATTYKLFAKARRVSIARIDGYFYYMRPGSIQQSPFSKKKMAQLRFAKEQKTYIDEKFPALCKATTDRLVSECFHILFSIGCQEGYDAEKKEIIDIIKSNRAGLILEKRTSKKTKYACILSYLGFGFTRWVYDIFRIKQKLIQ